MSELQKNNRNKYVMCLLLYKNKLTLFHENYNIKLFYDMCVMFAEIWWRLKKKVE